MRPIRDYYTRFYALGSLLLALFLLSPGSFLGLGTAFDQLNFRVWSTLFPPEQNVAEELALVSLPEGIITAKQVNLQSTLEFSAALSTLNDHKAGAIGIGADLDPVIWRHVGNQLAELTWTA